MNKAIVLASGGLDSCVTIACAVNDGYDVSLLHINYGQRTQKREDKAFDDIAAYYNIKNKMTVDIDYLKRIGGSSLTDLSMKVEEDTTPSSTISSLPSTYVPFRNANMISIAVSWAEVIGAKKYMLVLLRKIPADTQTAEKYFMKNLMIYYQLLLHQKVMCR